MFDLSKYRILEDFSEFNIWAQSVRYKILKLERAGKFYLFKQAQDEFHASLIPNEMRWRQFFEGVDAKDVSCTKIVDIGADWILFDWVEAPVLARRTPEGAKALAPHVNRYTELIAAIDKAAEGYIPETPDHEAIRNGKNHRLTLDPNNERILNLLRTNWLDQDRLERAVMLFEKYLPYVEKRYQHGDFTPWHVFNDHDHWLIYDAEHANSLRARYTDLVYSYLRIYTHCRASKLSAQLLKHFIEVTEVDTDQLHHQTMSLFVSRAVSHTIDSYNDRETIDYRSLAIESLDRVLKDDLSVLIRA